MKKLYIVWPSDWWDWSYYLCNEDWFVMTSHYCSHIWWAESDLIEWRPERKEKWKEYLKDWYELITATESDAKMLWEKNKKFSDKDLMEKYAQENWFSEIKEPTVEISLVDDDWNKKIIKAI